jgi:uncharacterized membrane protein YccC
MSDQSKQWQEIASQGIATERALRARIEQLEAALDRAVTRGLEQVERIATLEAALRDIQQASMSAKSPPHSWYYGRAEAVLNQSSPPKALHWPDDFT